VFSAISAVRKTITTTEKRGPERKTKQIIGEMEQKDR
jgi:hypothetical protein